MYKQIRSILIGIAFIAGVIVLYRQVIFQPSIEIFKSNFEREFVSDMKLKKYFFDNTIESVIVSAKSMSSRTMIRKKIVEYYKGNLTFKELKEYTKPKYIDGLNAISACNYGARYIDNKLLVEYSEPGCNQIDSFIHDTTRHEIRSTVQIEGTNLIVAAISPILHQGKFLGFDIIQARYPNILNKILDSSLSLEILPFVSGGSRLPDTAFSKNSMFFFASKSNYSDRLYRFSIKKSVLYSGLEGYKVRQLFIMLLFSFSIVLIMVYINQRVRLFYFKRGKFLEKLVARKTDELKLLVKELENANNALIQSQEELTESNKTKDKFFSIISHDLIGPFGAIVNLFSMLKKNELCDTKKTLLIEHGHASLQSTYRLLDNLLKWSRSQRGSIPFNQERIVISEIVDDVIGFLDQQAQAKSIEIENHMDRQLTAFIDKNMIETVFRNLISNAIKFTPQNGKIYINAEKDLKNNIVIVSIRDTGVGIDPEIKKGLFDMQSTTTTKGTKMESGTGLGLVLCREFIEKHNGKIWVESEPQKGSTFKFTIPGG